MSILAPSDSTIAMMATKQPVVCFGYDYVDSQKRHHMHYASSTLLTLYTIYFATSVY